MRTRCADLSTHLDTYIYIIKRLSWTLSFFALQDQFIQLKAVTSRKHWKKTLWSTQIHKKKSVSLKHPQGSRPCPKSLAKVGGQSVILGVPWPGQTQNTGDQPRRASPVRFGGASSGGILRMGRRAKTTGKRFHDPAFVLNHGADNSKTQLDAPLFCTARQIYSIKSSY